MAPANKDQIRALLKSIETGEPGPVAVVNEAKYDQHNPQTEEGSEGLAALFKRLSETTRPGVNVVRAFEDGDFVFGHTEYDFATRRIGFEVFRFRGRPRRGALGQHPATPGAQRGGPQHGRRAGRGHRPGSDRAEAAHFVRNLSSKPCLVGGRLNQLAEYIDAAAFADHNPRLAGDVTALRAALEAMKDGGRQIDFQKVHRVLAEGSFVLCVSEGNADGVHSAFYDLFRVAGGKLVERWDTTEKIAPRSECKNDNGKF